MLAKLLPVEEVNSAVVEYKESERSLRLSHSNVVNSIDNVIESTRSFIQQKKTAEQASESTGSILRDKYILISTSLLYIVWIVLATLYNALIFFVGRLPDRDANVGMQANFMA